MLNKNAQRLLLNTAQVFASGGYLRFFVLRNIVFEDGIPKIVGLLPYRST
ncbi:hypothetical protein [Salipaludibacillus neizhouensis]|nr:hypothetical protein [Salipaludibacillus neizhouensis]